jgi:hypothetical protein
MKVGAVKHLGRVDIPQYDLTAVFEAVVNAVAHRDYSVYGSKIRLKLFSDRPLGATDLVRQLVRGDMADGNAAAKAELSKSKLMVVVTGLLRVTSPALGAVLRI